MYKFHLKTFPNGLRILMVPSKESLSFQVTVLVNTGAEFETKENNGISHFLEHMCFKGTKRRPSNLFITKELDNVGGSYNASTYGEYTGYYARVAKENKEFALDIVSDIYLNSQFPPKEQALKTVGVIDITDKKILELVLAILYMGEGTKKKVETSMGNSDPLILKFFLAALKRIYDFDLKKIKCQLSLRADQNPEEMKRFWSKKLGVPINNFGYVNLDKRTIGSKTYPSYKGVCYVRCGNVAIQRKLMYLSEVFCKKVIKKYLGG